VRLPRSGIRVRIYSGTGILVALGLLLAGIAVAQLASIDRQVAAMAVRSDGNTRVLEIERLLDVTDRVALAYRLSGDPAFLKQGSDADAAAEALVQQAVSTARLDDERRMSTVIIAGIAEFRRTRNVLAIMGGELHDMKQDLADGGDAIVRQSAQLSDATVAAAKPELIGAARAVEKSAWQVRSDAWRFLAAPDANRQAAFKADAAKALDELSHLQEIDAPDDVQSATTAVALAIAPYASNFDQLSAEMLKQQDLFSQQLQPQIDRLLQLVRGASETQRQALADAKQITDGLIGRTIFVQKSIAGLALALGLLIAVLVGHSVTRPLARMTAAMTRLAGGDTAVQIPSRAARDEVGAMAKAVEVFRQNAIARNELEAAQRALEEQAAQEKRAALVTMAETIESQTTRALEHVGGQTASMGAMAGEMAASAARTDGAAQDAAAAAAHALSTAQTAASAAEELAASVREISSRARASSEVVSRAIDAGRATRDTIETLNERVAKIGAVADIISEIAARTNLLALNATIEAARVGEAGRGFAVVASEVKQLATQTARSTEEIARHIDEVRTATGASVAAVGQIEQTIGEVNAIAGSIAVAVQEQGAATLEIARSVAETATAAGDMVRRVTDVSSEAEQTTRRASAMRTDTVGLANAVGELQHAVIKAVRAATPEVDRRRHARYPVRLDCQMLVAGSEPWPGVIVELSEGGARVLGGPALTVDASGVLLLGAIEAPLPFTVRSTRGDALHVAFALDDAAAEPLRRLLRAECPLSAEQR
jgi:methyl-accepting chemotaxis protein